MSTTLVKKGFDTVNLYILLLTVSNCELIDYKHALPADSFNIDGGSAVVGQRTVVIGCSQTLHISRIRNNCCTVIFHLSTSSAYDTMSLVEN